MHEDGTIPFEDADARYTGRAHAMQPYIEVQPGEAMSGAGPHFPVVLRGGQPAGE